MTRVVAYAPTRSRLWSSRMHAASHVGCSAALVRRNTESCAPVSLPAQRRSRNVGDNRRFRRAVRRGALVCGTPFPRPWGFRLHTTAFSPPHGPGPAWFWLSKVWVLRHTRTDERKDQAFGVGLRRLGWPAFPPLSGRRAKSQYLHKAIRGYSGRKLEQVGDMAHQR